VAKSRHEGADNSNRSRHQRAVDCREMIFVGDGLSVHLLGLRLHLGRRSHQETSHHLDRHPAAKPVLQEKQISVVPWRLKVCMEAFASQSSRSVLFATPTDHELVGPRLTLFKPPG
jgi:hypothetical protein